MIASLLFFQESYMLIIDNVDKKESKYNGKDKPISIYGILVLLVLVYIRNIFFGCGEGLNLDTKD